VVFGLVVVFRLVVGGAFEFELNAETALTSWTIIRMFEARTRTREMRDNARMTLKPIKRQAFQGSMLRLIKLREIRRRKREKEEKIWDRCVEVVCRLSD